MPKSFLRRGLMLCHHPLRFGNTTNLFAPRSFIKQNIPINFKRQCKDPVTMNFLFSGETSTTTPPSSEITPTPSLADSLGCDDDDYDDCSLSDCSTVAISNVSHPSKDEESVPSGLHFLSLPSLPAISSWSSKLLCGTLQVEYYVENN
mgnify:CR=1 FL=1